MTKWHIRFSRACSTALRAQKLYLRTWSLNPVEATLVEDVMASESLTRMELEFAAVGNSLVWHKNHFEMLDDTDAEDCPILMQHSQYNLK